ncbi:hypothetical protein IMZ48_11615 [Candidatus Bathyarchaeota archaeon]|nr:hypothetical protein [Candidatus Bathyarchaeota archaeon]
MYPNPRIRSSQIHFNAGASPTQADLPAMAAPSDSSAPAPFLSLPSDILEEIFTAVFQSTTISSNMTVKSKGSNNRHALAILSVCWRFYHEASPLVIPNLHAL